MIKYNQEKAETKLYKIIKSVGFDGKRSRRKFRWRRADRIAKRINIKKQHA